ncbi:hypothetical protein ACFQBU_03445 [Jhaorihella thermophila]
MTGLTGEMCRKAWINADAEVENDKNSKRKQDHGNEQSRHPQDDQRQIHRNAHNAQDHLRAVGQDSQDGQIGIGKG